MLIYFSGGYGGMAFPLLEKVPLPPVVEPLLVEIPMRLDLHLELPTELPHLFDQPLVLMRRVDLPAECCHVAELPLTLPQDTDLVERSL